MVKKKIIGIVGGMGPQAGLDLLSKIHQQTIAYEDSKHLSVILMSYPSIIPDRSIFLTDSDKLNPAYSIIKIINKLRICGASVVGLACNTAYAPQILNPILNLIDTKAINLLNMPLEVIHFLKKTFPHIKKIGILTSYGSSKIGLYRQYFQVNKMLEINLNHDQDLKLVQEAIYNPKWGIKATADEVSTEARDRLTQAIEILYSLGAEAVILGCTEIPLAFRSRNFSDIPLIDPNLILARALIRESSLVQLKPWSDNNEI
jgi:aspartate racemase